MTADPERLARAAEEAELRRLSTEALVALLRELPVQVSFLDCIYAELYAWSRRAVVECRGDPGFAERMAIMMGEIAATWRQCRAPSAAAAGWERYCELDARCSALRQEIVEAGP